MTRRVDRPEGRASTAPQGLDAWLGAAREDLRHMTPPPWLQAQLIARVDERRALEALRQCAAPLAPTERPAGPRSRGPRLVQRLALWFGLPAAALAVLLWAGVLLRPLAPQPSAPAPAPFLALAPLDSIAAARDAVVVPAQVPRAQLADYGLPIDPARADQPARAELLMSAHGVVLAVRFVE